MLRRLVRRVDTGRKLTGRSYPKTEAREANTQSGELPDGALENVSGGGCVIKSGESTPPPQYPAPAREQWYTQARPVWHWNNCVETAPVADAQIVVSINGQ